MKLLLFSDVHCDRDAVERLIGLAASADVVIGAGDFATCRRGLAAVIAQLSVIDRPTVLVAGNSETDEELRAACVGWPAARVLHGEAAEISGATFFGLGGAVPVTPFGEGSFDLTEEDAAARLATCPRGAVLVTHSPPSGAVDRDSRGRSLGSRAVRATIERCEPKLAVCGHIHGSSGKLAWLGPTPVVNAGPAGMWWEVEPLA